jgi:hypothetical protein
MHDGPLLVLETPLPWHWLAGNAALLPRRLDLLKRQPIDIAGSAESGAPRLAVGSTMR